MALFARRIIQHKLNALREGILTPKHAGRLVSQLNSASRHVIPTEWEIIVVAAFAKHALLQYEPAIGSGRPDIFVDDSRGDKHAKFIADVTSVSDHGTDENNPSNYLRENIFMMALRLGVDFHTLGWHVGCLMEGRYPDQRVKVLLPPKAALHSFLQTSIRAFLCDVRAEPCVSHELAWKEPGIDFRLIHDPAQRQSRFGGPLVATVAYSKTKNPCTRR